MTSYPDPPIEHGTRPLGRRSTVVLIVLILIFTFTVGIVGAIYLVRTAENSPGFIPPAPEDSAATEIADPPTFPEY